MYVCACAFCSILEMLGPISEEQTALKQISKALNLQLLYYFCYALFCLVFWPLGGSGKKW